MKCSLCCIVKYKSTSKCKLIIFVYLSSGATLVSSILIILTQLFHFCKIINSCRIVSSTKYLFTCYTNIFQAVYLFTFTCVKELNQYMYFTVFFF